MGFLWVSTGFPSISMVLGPVGPSFTGFSWFWGPTDHSFTGFSWFGGLQAGEGPRTLLLAKLGAAPPPDREDAVWQPQSPGIWPGA